MPPIEPPADESENRQYRSPSYRTELELIRVLLANDVSLSGVEIDEALFTSDETRALYNRIVEIAGDSSPGQSLDLGAAIGSDDTPQNTRMSELALEDRPLSDPLELVNWLEAGRIDSKIESVNRSLRQVDEKENPETYSELWRELISLQKDKRTRRSDR